ncbi:MAG: hypothetical protein ACE3L7_27125 [Candidatus Pristimantibacillus sp.]
MKLKIRNYYYLIAGVLALLFAYTHAWNGHSSVLPNLDIGGITTDTQTVFTYVWHIITAENLVFGIAFIFMSFQGEQSMNQYVAWIIVAMLCVRLMVIFGVTAMLDVTALTDTLLDSVAIVIYVALIVLGARIKKKQSVSLKTQQ